jgi:hypothetical protein
MIRTRMIRTRNINSDFIQRDVGRLYGTTKMSEQEYGAEFVLNGSNLSVINPMRTFLTSLAKSISNLPSIFHASYHSPKIQILECN